MKKIKKLILLLFISVMSLAVITGCEGTEEGAPTLTPDPDLAVPQNIKATDGDFTDKIIITWETAEGSEAYRVYRATTADGDFSSPVADGLTGTPWQDTNTVSGTHYFYKISALKDSKESVLSSADEGFARIEAPVLPPDLSIDTPTEVRATDGDFHDKIVITWNAVEDADFYRIYRSATSDGDFSSPFADNITDASWEDTGVIPGTHYYYKLKTVRNSHESKLCIGNEGFASIKLPESPLNLIASDGEPGMIKIIWQAPEDEDSELLYNIYRTDESGENTVKVNASPVSGLEYEDRLENDNGPEMALNYIYTVKTVKAELESPASDTDPGWAGIPAPQSFEAWSEYRVAFLGKIVLKWTPVSVNDTPVSGIVYKASYQNIAGSTWYESSTEGTSLAFEKVLKGSWYNIRIKAVKNGHESSYAEYPETVYSR